MFEPKSIQNVKSPPHILILGSSYVPDLKLSANNQLSDVSIFRLAE